MDKISEPMNCSIDVFQELLCEVLERGETTVFRVYGYSMLPTIVNGDVAHVVRFDAADAKLGDVLVYKRGRSLYVHRLVSKSRDSKTGSLKLITAGDGLTYLDMPIDEASVIGKVIAIEHDGKIRLLDTLANKFVSLARVLLAKHPLFRSFLRGLKQFIKPIQIEESRLRGQ